MICKFLINAQLASTKYVFNMNYWFICNLQNKMYGIDSTLMEKMEMRLRQKIYKEMLEQQAKQKRQNFQSNNKNDYYNRTKTQPNQQQRKYNKPNNIFQQTTRGLDHSSTFLPVINNKKSRSGMYEQPPQEERKYSQEYQRYLQRREKKQHNKGSPYRLTREEDESYQLSERQTIPNRQSPPDQSEDDMTQLYLQQCEQIISSLKDITLKNSKKVKPKPNKYEPQQTFLVKRAPSRSFRINQQARPKSKAFTPKHYSFSDPRTPISYSSLQIDPNNQFSELTPSKEIKLGELPYRQKDTKRQLNQFSPFQESKLTKVSTKSDKIRQNNRKISPLRQSEEKASEQEEPQQETKQQKSKNKKQTQNQEKPKNKKQDTNQQAPKTKNTQKKTKVDDKGKQKQQKTKGKAENSKQQKSNKKQKKEQPLQNDLERQQKKQSAIIKYLKKARACGNLLYQKIQGHKKGGEQEGQATNQKAEQAK